MVRDLEVSARLNVNIQNFVPISKKISTFPRRREPLQTYNDPSVSMSSPRRVPVTLTESSNVDPYDDENMVPVTAPGDVKDRENVEEKHVQPHSNSKANLSSNKEKDSRKMELEALTATIISAEFWPELQEEECKLPAQVETLMKEFGDRYAAIKAPRTLEWQPLLGLVDVQLELEDRTLDFQVSPLLASAIGLFDGDHSTWTLSDLAEEMEVEDDMLGVQMNYWVNAMVLRLNTTAQGVEYSVIEILTEEDNIRSSTGTQNVEMSAPTLLSSTAASSRQIEDVQTYVIALLNTGDLVLADLHQRMMLFRSADFSYTLTANGNDVIYFFIYMSLRLLIINVISFFFY